MKFQLIFSVLILITLLHTPILYSHCDSIMQISTKKSGLMINLSHKSAIKFLLYGSAKYTLNIDISNYS